MRVVAAILLAAVGLVSAQTPEQDDLNRTVADAGNSAIDLIRGLEQYLKKYPDAKQRAAIENALAKSALQTDDVPRILLYGVKVLDTQPPDPQLELQLIDRVIRALAERRDPESAKKALEYSKRYEDDITKMRSQGAPQHYTPGQWAEQIDRAWARVFALEAYATGSAGNAEEALKLARKSWASYPTGEGAREVAGWSAKLGHDADALEFYANAFTLDDVRSTEADRAKDRMRLGALYAKVNGSEKGLGDLILQAWDRNAAMMNERRENLKAKDPNAEAVNVVDFTLPAIDGSPALSLSSLKGKTIVMDFWATWCVPCRAQHPLIESVKKRFEKQSDVVFLAIDTDDDTSLVVPFLKAQGWSGSIYFEGGLERRLVITSIPTVLVLNPAGKVSSRMGGFVPERFEDLLAERIEEARKAP